MTSKVAQVKDSVIDEKNYRALTNKAEKAFAEKEYLQAFLLQSCIFEGVVKSYATIKLAGVMGRSEELKRKFANFELARLIDELFIAGMINKGLYEQLSEYRKRRNSVTHQILQYGDKSKSLEKGLKATYVSGRKMKGSILDDLIRSKKGKTMTEVGAELEASLAQFKAEMDKAFEHDFLPNFNKEIRKITHKLKTKKST